MAEIGLQYGQALYSLAQQEHLEEEILRQLLVLRDSFQQEADFCRLMQSANLSKQERCAILEECFRDKVHLYVLNFLRILANKDLFKVFSQCVRAYSQAYDQAHNILEVVCTTAVELSREQQQALTDKLRGQTGKEVRLVCRLDRSVLGGVRLDYDGIRVEDTVALRLDNIRHLLKNTVL